MLRSAGLDITQQSALGKLTEDPWEEELIVMAEVRSYFQVTYKVCRPSFSPETTLPLTVYDSGSSTTSHVRSTTIFFGRWLPQFRVP
jgi:hypothetical protein